MRLSWRPFRIEFPVKLHIRPFFSLFQSVWYWQWWPAVREWVDFNGCWINTSLSRGLWKGEKSKVYISFERFLFLISIDDYAKDGGPGEEVWLLCNFYHEPLRTWIKTNVNNFAIWSQTVCKLDKQALRNYLKLTCEYELHILPNTKVSAAKDHGKNYMKVRQSVVRHL